MTARRRRRITQKVGRQLTKLQVLREGLKDLRALIARNREAERLAFDRILSDQQDRLLDGERLDDDPQAALELYLLSAFTVNVYQCARKKRAAQ